MQRGSLFVICLLATLAAGRSPPDYSERWKVEYLENVLDEALKYLEKQQEDGKELIKTLKMANFGDAVIQNDDPKPSGSRSPKKSEAGSDYSDNPIQSGGLNNADLMEKFSKFKPTRTKEGGLHMKLAQKPGEETVYKFNVNELRQLARTAHQEDSPPKKSAGFLRPPTGAGKLPGTLPGSIQGEQGPERVGQGHTIFRQALLPNYKEEEIPISNDYGLYGGDQAKNPSSYDDYSPNADYDEDDSNNYPGSDYSDGGQNNEASGLLEKFSKFKPTRTKDGVLHMKLAQKPGEETVYKFNVNELRQLAKTAHQVDARRR